MQPPGYDADPAHEQELELWCVPRPAVDQGPSVGSSIQRWPRIGSGSKVGCGSGGRGGLRAQGRIREAGGAGGSLIGCGT